MWLPARCVHQHRTALGLSGSGHVLPGRGDDHVLPALQQAGLIPAATCACFAGMKRGMARTARFLLAGCGWLAVVSILWVALLRFIPPPVTWLMAEQASVQGGIERTWTPMDRIAPALTLAVIAAETQLVLVHVGN